MRRFTADPELDSKVDTWLEDNSTPFLNGLDWDHLYDIAQNRHSITDARTTKVNQREAMELVELLLHRNPQRDPLEVCVVAYEMIILWAKLHSVHTANKNTMNGVVRLARWLYCVKSLIEHLDRRFTELYTSLHDVIKAMEKKNERE